MRLQRVRHDSATELNWTDWIQCGENNRDIYDLKSWVDDWWRWVMLSMLLLLLLLLSRYNKETSKFVVVQLLSCIRLFVTTWTAACQASLSFTISLSLLTLVSIESVMPSNHLILCCPLLHLPSIFPASGSFPISQLFASGGQSIGVSASPSVLPMNIQGWLPLGLTGLIFLQSKSLLQHHSSKAPILWHSAFFMVQLSHLKWLLEKP